MDDSKPVRMFVGSECHACHEQMEFLRRSGVAFTAANVFEDAAARKELVALGSKMVPTTVIGDEVIIGFDRERICAVLGLAPATP